MGVGDLVGRDDHRAEGRVGVLTLRIDPLSGTPAVAGTDVDEDAVSEHILERVFGTDPAGGAPDDHRQFDLPIELLGDRGVVMHRVSRSDHRGRRLGEDHRLLRQILVRVQALGGLRNMGAVVEADAENVLARPLDRSEQRHVVERKRGADRKALLLALRQELGERGRRGQALINERLHVVRQRDPDHRAQPADVDDRLRDQCTESSLTARIRAVRDKPHILLRFLFVQTASG